MFGKICFVMICTWFLFMPDAYAYIDPGTGSMILQALAACGVAILIFGKNIYHYVRGLFVKNAAGGDDAGNEDAK